MHNVRRQHLSVEAQRRKAVKEASQIQLYRKLTDSILLKKEAKTYNEEAFNETTDLLSQNPEFYTVWNYRRDIISNFFQLNSSEEALGALFDKELMFTLQQMKNFPKVYWLWNHRVWLLENHPAANWQFELGIVNKLLTADSRNFHGWHYRRFVIDRMEHKLEQSMALQEFEYTTSMINKDFSNFSAWHNRTKLIPILFEQRAKGFENELEFLEAELTMLQNAMYTDPEDQSFWVYLRWLLTTGLFVKNLEQDKYLEILQHQLKIVSELNELEKLDNGVDSVWCLKTIVQIQQLIKSQTHSDQFISEIKSSLQVLAEIDPLRKTMYLSQQLE